MTKFNIKLTDISSSCIIIKVFVVRGAPILHYERMCIQ